MPTATSDTPITHEEQFAEFFFDFSTVKNCKKIFKMRNKKQINAVFKPRQDWLVTEPKHGHIKQASTTPIHTY